MPVSPQFTLALVLLVLVTVVAFLSLSAFVKLRTLPDKRTPWSLLLLLFFSLGCAAFGLVLLYGDGMPRISGASDAGEKPTYSRQLVQTRGNFVSPEEVERLIREQIARERASRPSSPSAEASAQTLDEDRLRVVIRRIIEEELSRAPASATEEAGSSVFDTVPAFVSPSLTVDDVRAIVRETLGEDTRDEERIREIAAGIVAANGLNRSDVREIAQKVVAAGQATPELVRRIVGAMNLAGGGHDHAPKEDPETSARLGAIEAALKDLSGGDLPIVSEVIVARLYVAATRAKLGAPRDTLTLRVDEIEASGRTTHLTLSINGVEYKARNLRVDGSFGPFEVGGREYVFRVSGIVGVPENRVTGVLRLN